MARTYTSPPRCENGAPGYRPRNGSVVGSKRSSCTAMLPPVVGAGLARRGSYEAVRLDRVEKHMEQMKQSNEQLNARMNVLVEHLGWMAKELGHAMPPSTTVEAMQGTSLSA